MIIDQRVTIAAPVETVWEFVMDVPAVGSCLPGAESVTLVDDDTYRGALRVKVGPIALRLAGTIAVIERDPAARRARMDLQAADQRLSGGVKGTMQLQLEPRGEGQTELSIHTDVAVLGKLGEFGQAVIRKKADQMLAELARNLSRVAGRR